MVRILPVIDLKDGQVVRGVAGRRSEYRPVESCIAAEASPQSVACALVERFGFSEVYVADLNALAGCEPDWDNLQAIAQYGLRLWVDAGLTCAEQVVRFERFGQSQSALAALIVALESVDSPRVLASIFEAIGDRSRAVFSLDLRQSEPLTSASPWMGRGASEIAQMAVDVGFQRLLALDLACVGTGSGPGTGNLCRQLRAEHAHLQIISGGGVRDVRDVQQLARDGCDVVLVASALHNGRITQASIRELASD